ncbi:MAG: alpha-galactosidase [Lachnospiraceae bacterium]
MVIYDSDRRVFKLDTENTSYVMGVTEEGYLGNIYYGKKVDTTDLVYAMRTNEHPFTPAKLPGEKTGFMDRFPMEYPFEGTGDFHGTCISIRNSEGQEGLELKVKSHNIYAEKRKLAGMPSARGDGTMSLDIVLSDDAVGSEVVLTYTVYEECDIITRSVKVVNTSDKAFYVTKALSACLNLETDISDILSLHGSWARERHIQRSKINYGSYVTESLRGEPGHQDHPFIALLSENCNKESGDVYAMNLVYSGNFIARVQKDQFGKVRATIGINPERFTWKLENGQEFVMPEVIMQYTCKGTNGMTNNFHDFFRKYLLPQKWAEAERPVLINNWEATYFDFDDDKLVQIAEEASKSGIEMLVMDDGWFGHRNADNSSLGDWYVNEEKIKGGLKNLVDRVNALGMKFGIWFEPEMISPDSDLYREHPDWALALDGREPGLCRTQYMLDFSRHEVVDYIYGRLYNILKSANIEYVKWDMNRPIAEAASLSLPADRQGEVMHRHVLALYELQERLVTDFPDLLLENCSGGGARFDAGMLYYSPQIWCSDNADPVERLMIQEGTHLLYPLSTTGTHVADSPNHVNGRVTPFDTRADVALTGTFGYELDITKIDKKERELIPAQIEKYKKYRYLVQTGDYYRLASFAENGRYDSYMVVSKDKSQAVLIYVQVVTDSNVLTKKLKLYGLEPGKKYIIDGVEYLGSTLMNVGYIMKPLRGDFQSAVVEINPA